MKLLEFLMVKAAEESTEITKAFTKALTFGIDSVDPKNGKTNRQKIVEEVNDLLVFIKLLREEGVELPGIGDPTYLSMRTAKAIEGAAEARKRGIITDITMTIENDGLEQTPAVTGVVEGGSEPSATDDETYDRVRAITYASPSAGDAAPNAIVEVLP